MRIFDIDIYRDGGSIEFRIEKKGVVRHIWLDTPFKGEPRALLVDSIAVGSGSPEIPELIADIEAWRVQLPQVTLDRIEAKMRQKCTHFNPSVEEQGDFALRLVLRVRDYVFEVYSA
jgi:hypothetical protein